MAKVDIMEKSEVKYQADDLLCGIDGGGTTTRVVVCTREGQVVFALQTGTINHYGAGTEKAMKCFFGIAEKLVEHFGCLPGTIFVGNSALSGLASDELVQTLTGGAFQPAKVVLHSDVYIALLGFTMGNPGAVLISGTGSMACGIDSGGHYHTAGGWGQVLGDEGSGYHMALEGIKAGLRAYDGVAETTMLTGSLKRFFCLDRIPDLIDKIYNPPVEKSVIAAFAVEVEKSAGQGDQVALKILAAEAEWLYRLALAITNKCQTGNLGYYGSVLNRNEQVRAHLAVRLKEHSIVPQLPVFTPEIGALIGAFLHAGLDITKTVTDNLLKYESTNI